MNTTENNKLIAEFMNWSDIGNKGIQWDWLMEVVEKIEGLEDTERFEITNSGVNITHYQTKEVKFIYNGYHTNNGMYLMTEKAVDTKIEAVYMAVVEFIKWYNENSADKN